MFEHFEDFEKFVEIYNKAKQSDDIIEQLKEENARLLLENSELKAANKKAAASGQDNATRVVTDLSKTFAPVIKAIHDKYEIPYTEIAKDMGHSGRWASNIAHGNRNITAADVNKLKEIYKVRDDGSFETRGRGGEKALQENIRRRPYRYDKTEAVTQC